MINFNYRIMAVFLCCLVCFIFGACKTTAPDNLSSGTLGGGMLGFEDEDPFWSDWTPREPVAIEVSDELQPTTVFDVWRIDDPRFVEPLWDVIFHMLGMLQMTEGIGDASAGLQYLQAHLDPQWNDVTLEIIFLSQTDANAEGLLLRFAATNGASIWIEAHRQARGTENPARWRFLADPAAAEAPPVGMEWIVGESGQVFVVDDPQRHSLGGQVWPELMTILEEVLWEEVSGRNYLEPNFEVHDGGDELASYWPASLGQEVRQREISDYVPDTRFVSGFSS